MKAFQDDDVPNDDVPNDDVLNDDVPNDDVPNYDVPNDDVLNDVVPNDAVWNDVVRNDVQSDVQDDHDDRACSSNSKLIRVYQNQVMKSEHLQTLSCFFFIILGEKLFMTYLRIPFIHSEFCGYNQFPRPNTFFSRQLDRTAYFQVLIQVFLDSLFIFKIVQLKSRPISPMRPKENPRLRDFR